MARRVLTIGTIGGTAALGMLALAAPAAALPPATPAVPLAPVPPPALVMGPVDGVVGTVSGVPAVSSTPPAIPEPNVPDAPDATGTTALAAAPQGSPLPKGPLRRPSTAAHPSAATMPLASPGRGRADYRTRAGSRAPARELVAPPIDDEVVNLQPVGVTGALDLRSHSGLGSTLGTAAASFALWGALCLLAFVARLVAISAWGDAQRRRRVLSPR